jgi:hypothetical protein
MPRGQNFPTLIDKNRQNLSPVCSMISVGLNRQFLPVEEARAPDTIIGILKKKLRS